MVVSGKKRTQKSFGLFDIGKSRLFTFTMDCKHAIYLCHTCTTLSKCARDWVSSKVHQHSGSSLLHQKWYSRALKTVLSFPPWPLHNGTITLKRWVKIFTLKFSPKHDALSWGFYRVLSLFFELERQSVPDNTERKIHQKKQKRA